MESSTACFPVYDFLKDHDVKVRVAHPKRVKAISSAKVKTDKVDARILAQLEKADLIPEAYVPNKRVQELRGLARHHMQLVKQQTKINNQLKAVLLRQGISYPKNLFAEKAGKLLELEEMPEDVRLLLTHERKQYALLEEGVKEVDERIESLAKENKDAVLLNTIPGVGWFSAFLIATQIDGVNRFPSVDNLVSYAGLCPSIRQSGGTTHMGGIGHDSYRLLRWILIQDTWMVVRYNVRFRRLYRKLSRKKEHQKAIVAVAKRLLTVMFFMLRNQTAFNPKAGGS